MNVDQRKSISLLSVFTLISVVVSLVPAFLLAFPFWKDMSGSYFHQPLLLAVTVWLILQSRKTLVPCECSGTGNSFWPKALGVLFGSYFYCIIILCGLTTLLSLAVPLYVGAIVYFLFERTLLRKSLFCLVLLGLSFPLPNLLVTGSEWFLKKGTIWLSTLVLTLFDNTTVCTGSTILSFGESVKIGLSCSGINSFLILIPLVLVASRLFSIAQRRIFWIWLSLPLTVIVCNSLRVASMFLASPFIAFSLSLKHFHTIGPVFFFINAWLVLFMMRRVRR